MSSPLPGWESITTRAHGSSGASSEVDDGIGVNLFEPEVDQLAVVHPSPSSSRKGARMTTGPRTVKRYSDGCAVAGSSGALNSEYKLEGAWTRLFDRNDRPLKKRKMITDEPASASAPRIRGNTSSFRDNDHEKPRRTGPAGPLQRGRTSLPDPPSRLQNRFMTTANSYIVNQVTGAVKILDSEDDDGKEPDSPNGEDEGSGDEQGDKGDGDDGDDDDDGEEEERTVGPRRVLQLARKSTGGKMPAAQLASLNRAHAQTPTESSSASSESEEGLYPPKVMTRTTPSTSVSAPAPISTPTARKLRPPAPAPAPRSRKPIINNPFSRTHSLVSISSDDSEDKCSSHRTPHTPRRSPMVKQSDSTKARNRFTDAGQTSRLGTLFARLPSPQGEAEALGGPSWTALGRQPQLPADAQTPRRTSPTKESTLNRFAKQTTRGVNGREITVGELIRAPPSTTTRHVSAFGNFTQATPSGSTAGKITRLMGYTPPSPKSARDRVRELGDHKLPPQPDMRSLEQALGLESASATHRGGNSRENTTNTAKAKRKGKARATATSHAITSPPTTVTQVQSVSPELIADEKGKGRAGDRPQRGMTIAEAIQESGAINQPRGSKTENSTKKKKRKVPMAPINVSGVGSKDDPLDLTLDSDGGGNSSIPKPRAVDDSGLAAQIPIPLAKGPKVEVTKATIMPPGPVRVATPVPQQAVQAAVLPSVERDLVTRKRTNFTPPTPLPSIPASKLREMLDESRANLSAVKREKELVQSSTSVSRVTGPAAASLNTVAAVQQPLRLQPSTVSTNSLSISQIPTDGAVGGMEVFTSHRSPSEDRLRSSSGSSSGEQAPTTKAAKGITLLPLPSTIEIAPASNPSSRVPDNRVHISSGTVIPQRVEVQTDTALDGDEDDEDDMTLLPLLTDSLAGPAVSSVKTEDEPEQVSDLDGVMEVNDLLLPSWGSSSEMEDITTALEVQAINSAEQSPFDRSLEPSGQGNSPALQTPEAEDFGDPDFGIASEDDHQAGFGHLPRIDTQALLTKPANIFDGFEIVTFEDYRNEMKTQPFEVHWSRDLPHELQDLFNASSLEIQTAPQMRQVLQAYIQDHTTDEPDAPLIEIINNIDDEAIPPWEYHYSNRMWYADGIPPPDIKNLKGCDCIGRCDPKSKTCLCMQRQWNDIYNSTGIQSLAYDKAGRLKLPNCVVPVHECNVLCGCDEDCMNRVVQNGRKVAVAIQKTKNKGWGVFAGAKKIPKGSFLGIYAGELISESESERRGEIYNKFGRTYLFDVDFWFLPGKEEEGDDWEPKFVVDAYHAGNFTRYLNHSCNPNAKIHPCYINEANPAKPLIVIFSDRDIEPFEEICFSYHGNEDDEFDSQSQDKNKDDAIYVPCMCEAANCKGRMFS